jgi:hypothetical protein
MNIVPPGSSRLAKIKSSAHLSAERNKQTAMPMLPSSDTSAEYIGGKGTCDMLDDAKLDDFLMYAEALIAGGGNSPPGMLLQPATVRDLVQEIRAWRASSYIKGLPPPRRPPRIYDTCE